MNASSSTEKSQSAPPPDAPQKPDSLPEIKKPAWKYIARRALHEFSWDQCTDLAAALTYYAVLALFPALLALVAILGVIGQAKATTDAVLQAIQEFAPGQVSQLLRGPITQLVNSPSAGLALVVGIIGALWSASGYVNAFSRAMNRIYEIDEGRPFWKLRPTMLMMTVIAVVLAALMALILAVSGPVATAVGNVFGLGDVALTVWGIAKWPVLVILAIITLALLYYVTPNIKQPKFRWISVGAVIALVVMALASVGFAFYVTNFSHYNKTYGAIGGFIVLLLWLWIMNLALLFGAEFDSETERGRELQAGIKAAKTLQLPPRDDAKSKKREEKEEQAVEQGKELRERFGNDDD